MAVASNQGEAKIAEQPIKAPQSDAVLWNQVFA